VKLIERRIGLLFAIFLLLLVGAIARATWLGGVEAHSLKKAAAVQQESEVKVPARRGSIVDSKGVELAVSEPATTITATPYLIKNPVETANKLSKHLNRSANELLPLLARKNSGFAYVARKVPAVTAKRIEKMKIEGLDFVPESRRVYPRKWLASQVIGKAGDEGQGLLGLEYAVNSKLRGEDGERKLVKDARGIPIALEETKQMIPGAQIQLTLDSALQDRAEEVLDQVGQEYNPKGATAIVMDPRDSSILALANWPRVDANKLGDAPAYARQNRAINSTYEPGSTFKAITVAAALEEKKVTPSTVFGLPPTIRVADREIGESHGRGAVSLTTRGILEQSSNVGAVKIGLLVGGDRFDRWMRRFGFGKKSGVDLPGEEQGILLPRAQYSGSTMGNLPMGQGQAVTSMQMANAYAAIANGGTLRPPHIIRSVNGQKIPTPAGKRVIKTSTAQSLRKMLEGVLGEGGTASGAGIKGYVLAGKTGTSNKVDTVHGGYSKSKYVASFVGFAPAKSPKLLVAVMVDEPEEIYGGKVAAPAFREITSFALSYLKISPDS
jgi:cell division protein FtsI/penicillin-binding protein 2